jgi:hypothetical protein
VPSSPELLLLDHLLQRITYFGRAESLSLVRRASQDQVFPAANCDLKPEASDASPVLIPEPDQPLDVNILLAHSDHRKLKGCRIPPGTVWWYARLPEKPIIKPAIHVRTLFPVTTMQFVIGGRVYPLPDSWIRLIERFRGAALGAVAGILMKNPRAKFSDLPQELKAQFSLLTGKSGSAETLEGHRHLRLWLLPNRTGLPTRLVCYRATPFNSTEQKAFLAASQKPLSWQFGNPDWQLRLVPLPAETRLPYDLLGSHSVWQTLTPYVPSRHILGRNGKTKAGYSVAEQVQDDLAKIGFPEASITVDEMSRQWVKVHRPQRSKGEATNDLKLGYRVRVQFASAVAGPVCLGHSSHFGLGLFEPVTKTPN